MNLFRAVWYFGLSLVARAALLAVMPLSLLGIDGPMIELSFTILVLDDAATQAWDEA